MSARSLAATLGATALCLVACSKPAPPAALPVAAAAAVPVDGLRALAEAEPNDSPDQAQPVQGSARIAGDLHAVQPAARPDEDWYLVRPDAAPSDLRVELSGLPGGRLAVEAYDRDRNRLLAALAAAPGEVCLIPSLRLRGPVYLRVFAPSGRTGPYALAVKLTPADPDAEAEPNDRAVDATPLPLDHPMRGRLATGTDQDFWRVDLEPAAPDGGPAEGFGPSAAASEAGAPSAARWPPAPPPGQPFALPRGGTAIPVQPALLASARDGGLTLSLSPIGLLRVQVSAVPGVRLGLRVLDQDERPLLETEAQRPGEPLELRDLGILPGVRAVFLVLRSASVHGQRAGAPDSPYTLVAHREPAPQDFEVEPNDALDQATALATRRVGYLAPKGDVDYYLIQVAAPSLLHARLSGLDRVDTELSVVDRPEPTGAPQGQKRAALREKVLWRAAGDGPKEPELIPALALAPGDHYLEVRAAAHQVGAHWLRDQSNPDDTYELTASLTPDDGTWEREPNGTTALATPIRLGQTIKGYAYPARDLDLYRLDLSHEPIGVGVTLRLEGVPKVPLSLKLRGPAPSAGGKEQGPLVNTSDHGRAGFPEEFRAKLEPGVYFLEVRSTPTARVQGEPGGDPDDPYALSVTAE